MQNQTSTALAAMAALLLSFLSAIGEVDSHGRLIEPPSRSTMWRYGFDTPPNYNDHELYCGGFSRQWRTNGGKCGICGDPWDSPTPRANEAGGMYGKGIIARKYQRNQVIKVRVELTANHMGFFEFRLCPNNNKKRPATQKCLDQYVLQNAQSGDPRYYPGPGSKVFEMHYQLPKGLTCRQCVFQWRYVAGNNWGTCKNGTGAVGCGPQEEFRACADVTITEEDGTADDTANTLADDHDWDGGVDTDVNEVDYEEGGYVGQEEKDAEEIVFESVIVIVLCSLLLTAGFFAFLFFYYLKGRGYVAKYVKDVDLPKVSLPKNIKKMSVPKVAPKVGWPLSGIKDGSILPAFLRPGKSSGGKTGGSDAKKRTVSAPITVVSTTNEEATGPPNTVLGSPGNAAAVAAAVAALPTAPPRSHKKHPPPAAPVVNTAAARLATVASRPRNSRPSAPPPVVPPPPPVTVNGVSVRNGGVSGVIASARPAVVDADMPDSMEQQHHRGQDLEDVELTSSSSSYSDE